MVPLLLKIFRALFRFLSSLKLAVVTLLSLATVLAVGTVLESIHDTATAQYYVYHTFWFSCILGFLGLNVLFAALSRWPFKKHHIGFVITHLGILLLLAGSFRSLLQGYEGQLIIPEGEQTDKMVLQEEALLFISAITQRPHEIPVNFKFQNPTKENPFLGKVTNHVLVKVDEYMPHAVETIRVDQNSPYENPAVQIQVSGSRAKMEEWIFSREFKQQRLALGPASINFVDIPDLITLRRLLVDLEKLRGPVLYVDGEMFQVQNRLNQEISVKNGRLLIQKYFPNAGVSNEGIFNQGSERENPAVQFQWSKLKYAENHVAFAKFPLLPTNFGKEAGLLNKVRLIEVPAELGSQENELLLARLDDGKIYYSLRSQGKWSEILPYVKNQKINTGWMDFQFSILQQIEHAQLTKQFQKVSIPKGEDGPPPAIHVVIANAEEAKKIWIGRGDISSFELGGNSYRMAYGLKVKPLGFEVKLNDFLLRTYEGTNDPASFESHVTLIDSQDNLSFPYQVSMNNPLKYDDYKIFQASYQRNPGQPDISVLSIAHDPGIFLKYLGSLVMVMGIILMFFFRPLFMQKKSTKPVMVSEVRAYE